MKLKVIYLDRVDSTNRYARQLLNESSVNEGTVIWAGEQYAGRGLGDNSWHSQKEKNLTFSMILKPSFLQPEKLFCLNKAVALAVLNTIHNILPGDIPVTIKWPNDIYAGGRKIAGILIEHTIFGSMIKHSVIGVGINLNQTQFPAGIPNPVSVIQLTGKLCEPKAILEHACSNLEQEYSRLRHPECNEIVSNYDGSLFGFGIEQVFTASGSSFTGRIQGVDDLGRLCILTADGHVRSFNHGDITIK